MRDATEIIVRPLLSGGDVTLTAAGRQAAALFGGLAAMGLAAVGAPVTARPCYPLRILQLNVTGGTGSPPTFEIVALLSNDGHLGGEQPAVPAPGGVDCEQRYTPGTPVA